jgi:hypothetical protein
MNWKQAAKTFWPNLRPTRPAGFTPTPDGKGVLIAGFDEDVVVVVTKKDLYSLRNLVDRAIDK